MAHNNDEAVTLNDNKTQNDEDNSSLEEWTILDKFPDRILRRNISSTKKKDTDPEKLIEETEVAREAIQVLKEQLETADENNDDDINRNDSFVQRTEDSDGAIVISESGNKNDKSQLNNIVDIQTINDITTPPRTFMHIILACSLAAVIGFGIGRIVGKGETQLPVNDVNFGLAENTKYIHHSEELHKEMIMPDISIRSDAVLKKPKIISKQILNDEQFMDFNSNSKKVESLHDVLEKVKNSINILCSMIDRTDKSIGSTEYISVCVEPSSIMNLIELKSNVQNILTEVGYTDDPSNKWFIENMESKLKNISVFLADDLSKTIKEIVTKIDRKLDKMRRKLNNRLCMIRNTVGNDPKILETLSKYNVAEENCPTKKFMREGQAESDGTKNVQKKKKIEKDFHTYPVGPEVKLHTDDQSLKVQLNFKDQRNKEKIPNDVQEKFYKTKRDKSRKNFSKGDFTSEREAIELQKDKIKKIHQPIITTLDVEKKIDENINTKEFCRANSCSKQNSNDRKNSRDEKNENWQFKRSEGRVNWREEKRVIEDDVNNKPLWSDKRARGRKDAREKY